MSKKIKHIEGQEHLFTTPAGSGSNTVITPWQEIEGSPQRHLEVLVGDNIGPHVEIADRTQYLIRSMNAMAHRNMLIGFDAGVHHQQYKKPIWERYLDETPRVIDYSQTKAERLNEEAAIDFFHATGFTALKGTGMITRGEFRTRMNIWWRRFGEKVGDPDKHQALDKLRNQQRKLLPKDHLLQTAKGWRELRDSELRKQKVQRDNIMPAKAKVGEGVIESEQPKRDIELGLKRSRHIEDMLKQHSRENESSDSTIER